MKAAGAYESIFRARTYAGFRDRLLEYGCRRCSLHADRTHVVVDRGNPAAGILLVGEGPGAEEDRTGRAFVGRSGKLLDAMLVEAGIDPARDVLIANVVKCRPPENRPPSPEEASACLPYLARQIALVRPRAIGLLGATAARHVLRSRPASGVTGLAGSFVEDPACPGVPIQVLFHPAFILRSPSRRSAMVAHLRGLKERAEVEG